MSVCSVENCDKRAFCKRLCQSHYNQQPQRAAYIAEYNRSDKAREYQHRYNRSEPGRARYQRGLAARMEQYRNDAEARAAHADAQRFYKYGVTPEEWALLAAKGCAICGTTVDLVVDHDHSCCPGKRSCGKCVRGALCSRHNLGIGRFDDSVEHLLAAVAYLRAAA